MSSKFREEIILLMLAGQQFQNLRMAWVKILLPVGYLIKIVWKSIHLFVSMYKQMNGVLDMHNSLIASHFELIV